MLPAVRSCTAHTAAKSVARAEDSDSGQVFAKRNVAPRALGISNTSEGWREPTHSEIFHRAMKLRGS